MEGSILTVTGTHFSWVQMKRDSGSSTSQHLSSMSTPPFTCDGRVLYAKTNRAIGLYLKSRTRLSSFSLFWTFCLLGRSMSKENGDNHTFSLCLYQSYFLQFNITSFHWKCTLVLCYKTKAKKQIMHFSWCCLYCQILSLYLENFVEVKLEWR